MNIHLLFLRIPKHTSVATRETGYPADLQKQAAFVRPAAPGDLPTSPATFPLVLRAVSPVNMDQVYFLLQISSAWSAKEIMGPESWQARPGEEEGLSG